MKTKHRILLLVASMFYTFLAQAQIEGVIVEKYYVSDTSDGTDTIGGRLPAGSVTYRVFIDLAEGSKLLKIYGDENHALSISRTYDFFNNKDRGKSIGKEISSNRLDENTVALDTWITLGQASNSHYGIFKNEDPDGSIVGGPNNDGGSAGIPGGLLVNADPQAGMALTLADGLVPVTIFSNNWHLLINGVELRSSDDTTIFGSLRPGRQFFSNDFSLYNTGVAGATTNNRVLVAQLTTKGDLNFSLNVMIEKKNGKTVNYVASNPVGEEETSRFLTYPVPQPDCGCKDPGYIEYNKDLECHVQDSCKTIIVLGCTDPQACNYDPDANFNVPQLCCYPGKCDGRDIESVCPAFQQGNNLDFTVYPNPAQDKLTIEIVNGNKRDIQLIMYDSRANTVISENLGAAVDNDSLTKQMNIGWLLKGTYFIRLTSGDFSIARSFTKY